MKVHGLYKPTGTKSFRLACSKIFGRGLNLQQIPSPVKALLNPRQGKVFVSMDQASAESRIVAYLAEAGQYRRILELGASHHVYTALQISPGVCGDKYTGVPIEDLMDDYEKINKKIRADKILYATAKMINHASNYGVGGRELAINMLEKSKGAIAVSSKEATMFRRVYDATYPEIVVWRERTKRQVKDTRILRNLFGYPRVFNQQFTEPYLKEALSFIPQSTVGTLNNLVHTELQDHIELNYLTWNILLNTHDSLMLEVPKDDINLARFAMEQFYTAHKFTSPSDGTVFAMAVE